MNFEIEANVMPLKALLDPQGKAILGTIGQLGHRGVKDVRVGKHFVIQVEAEDENAARVIAGELCAKLLSNPVMEGFSFSIKAVE
ncbi:MAG: phosphoribosylformylglycinamidine synthase [Bacteroidia bacterium]|nr:MAG: phosphoribosylformylglycinamidine synthase [Bacteroidia bacterium]